MGVELRRRQHRELAPRQQGHDLPGPRERLVEAAQLVAPLVDEPVCEGVGEGEVLPVGRAQRGRADQLGELADLARPGQRREQLRGQVEVVVAGASRARAPCASAATATTAASTGG